MKYQKILITTKLVNPIFPQLEWPGSEAKISQHHHHHHRLRRRSRTFAASRPRSLLSDENKCAHNQHIAEKKPPMQIIALKANHTIKEKKERKKLQKASEAIGVMQTLRQIRLIFD